MNSEIVVGLSALLGTLVGGLINHLATRSAMHREWKLGMVRERLVERQKLYANFLVAAQSMVTQGMQEKSYKVTDFDAMNNLFAQIEFVGTSLVAADSGMKCNFD